MVEAMLELLSASRHLKADTVTFLLAYVMCKNKAQYSEQSKDKIWDSFRQQKTWYTHVLYQNAI